MGKASVLITTEGTYPFYPGGVSVWCDQLVRHLVDFRFHVFAITHSPTQPLRYQIPGNVDSLVTMPLWGTEEPGFPATAVSAAHRRKSQTNDAVIRERFLPAFEVALAAFRSPRANPETLAEALFQLQDYTAHFDYARSVTSPEAWQIFLEGFVRRSQPEERLNLEEATICMRWLARYLGVLTVPYPPVDIVHSSMAGLAGIAGVLGKLRHGSAFLLSEHGLHLRELYLWLGRTPYSVRCRRFLLRFHEAIVRMNYWFADEVTCLGQFNKSWQMKLGANPNKVRVIPNGVDPAVFSPRPAGPRSRPAVLTMARISPLKGIDVLIRAIALVRERVPEIELRIMGDVADTAYHAECLRIIEEHCLENHVTFGITNESHLMYNQADVFCLASLTEGMPYAVLEAMMSGCPVVATDVGNVAETLGGTGLLAKPNNAQSLARALLELMDGAGAPERRQRLAQSALMRARELYTLREATGQYRRIYQSLTYAAQTAACASSAD